MQNRLLIATLVAMAGAVIAHFILKRRINKQKLRQAYRNGAAAVALLAVLLVLAEMATRMIYPEIGAGVQAPAFIRNFSNEPVSRDTNRYGFRERDFDVKPPEGIVRIAVLGESVAAGHGLPVEERLSDLLEDRLNQEGNAFEVLNFGVFGDETIHQQKTLKKVLGSLHPDFILVQWFINDLEGTHKSDRPIYVSLIPSARIRIALEANSVLYAIAYNAWRNLQVSLGFVEHYWDYMADRFGDPNGEASLRAERELEELFRLAKDANVPIGMVLYIKSTARPGPEYPVDFLLDRVLDGCQRYQVTCVDLRPLFDGTLPLETITLSFIDPHPTAIVHEKAISLLIEDFGPVWQGLRPKGPKIPLQSARRGARR